MIKILKSLRKEKGLYLIITELDAKAADIITRDQKDVIDYFLEVYLTELSDHVDDDTVIRGLKEFLIESVFVHYIDMVGILNYIYTMRNVIKVAKKHPSHTKFLFVTEFKNYVDDEKSDNNNDNDDDNDEGASFDLSFKTELLNKKNLSFIEELLLYGFNSLYNGTKIGGRILVLKPKGVKMYLKEKKTAEGIKEFLHTNISFFKSNK
ncbi:hypothetical protein KAW18_03795 [candidate division WOR-3 bacterium]|nr:hypothetical protein [Candidatus Parcubacteria bacterium]MCK4526470.1 hypothetical protein [candidate division WOR-3 bacterium]